MFKMTRIFKAVLALLVIALLQSGAIADTSIDQAKAIFAKYQTLSNSHNPALVDLYSGSAIVRISRKFPDGQTRFLTFKGQQIKTVLLQALPTAKAMGDRDIYSKVIYKRVGNKVVIRAIRYNVSKRYSSPVVMVVSPNAKKKWLIAEQYEEIKP